MEEYKLQTPLGISAYLHTGDGVLPDEKLIFDLLTARFKRMARNDKGFLFVNFPENEHQFIRFCRLHITYNFFLYSVCLYENSNQIYERFLDSLGEQFNENTLAKKRIQRKAEMIEHRNQEVLSFIKNNKLSLVIEDGLSTKVKQTKISAFILDSSSTMS